MRTSGWRLASGLASRPERLAGYQISVGSVRFPRLSSTESTVVTPTASFPGRVGSRAAGAALASARTITTAVAWRTRWSYPFRSAPSNLAHAGDHAVGPELGTQRNAGITFAANSSR